MAHRQSKELSLRAVVGRKPLTDKDDPLSVWLEFQGSNSTPNKPTGKMSLASCLDNNAGSATIRFLCELMKRDPDLEGMINTMLARALEYGRRIENPKRRGRT